ncbi:DUF3055 domain-containing protein [Thermoflavimicrobium daqui]|jgi:hypothetical protein|uniref:DUF3055 domain-containing protein n=1 Tax=Thermoflavimicrobium daqui TaxID=2137476 RepID=A0A364K6S0_9BACL|nr:DUF3055 domain-containing protein [Thermoflavimicrobium daqui]RAL25977.1 hypothetical protein DL897_07890 [Thermoflavimicrobium daqui]
MSHERLYDESEQARVRFVGFVSDLGRYDFGIVYTHMFFGKPLVICMQTGRSSLLSIEDVDDLEYLKDNFNLKSMKEAEELAVFLRNNLPSTLIDAESEH